MESGWLGNGVQRIEQAKRINTLIAFFASNEQNRRLFCDWLMRYSIQRDADLGRLWFTGFNADEQLEKYAMGITIAFISLDDGRGERLGLHLSQINPECLICYCSQKNCSLRPLLNSRPFEFFVWNEGEEAFAKRLDNMLLRVQHSNLVFCYSSKRTLYCLPAGNIVFFRSDLKYVDIITKISNNMRVYAKLSDIEEQLIKQGCWNRFIRIHKSYVVNRSYIHCLDRQEHTVQLSTGDMLPISDAYYRDLCASISQFVLDPKSKEAIRIMRKRADQSPE